uniref:diphthine methyl ester synthase n=1 Tax=Acrobeloides nanus TaxID=290746 RepID=A0A914CDU7_9BILA
MVLYLIGLGLGNVEDITVRGLKIVKQCAKVYLEAYTSILCYGLETKQLEEFYEREVIIADRDLVENLADTLLEEAKDLDVALLVVGDPFGATTHADLVLRAKSSGVEVKVVHNVSILNAVGCCGLQLYSFGETVSIVMWTENWQPDSFYDKISANRQHGLHTLCLLDIKTKEQSVENLIKGRKIYEPPRYLTCSEAASQLIKILERKSEMGIIPAYDENTKVVALARVGWDDQKIVYCTLKELSTEVDMGPPLHSLIIPGPQTHPMELELLETFAYKK